MNPRTAATLATAAVLLTGCQASTKEVGTPSPGLRSAKPAVHAKKAAVKRPVPDPAAAMLAALDGARSTVPYRKALGQLVTRCTVKDQMELAEMIRYGKSDESKHGVDETALSITQHMYRSVPASAAPTDCQGILAAYLVLREPSN